MAEAPSPNALRGLKGFQIAIDPIDSDAQAAGLTSDLVKRDIELRLQAAGVATVPAAAGSEHGVLSVHVSTAKGEKGDWAFHIVVRILQTVCLMRGAGVVLPATSHVEHRERGPRPSQLKL
jgi:hypothetical protein